MLFRKKRSTFASENSKVTNKQMKNDVVMKKIELKAQDIPVDYPLCFNSGCADKDKCMHYQAWLLMPKERYHGPAVYPTAWEDGACRCFQEKKLVRKAWGFTKLYDNVPRWQRAEARRCVHALFGKGNGPYYRVHNGENVLSPEEQEQILQVVAKFGSTEGIGFDHYVTDWNFEY